MLCRARREISLTVLLVNCHDVTGRIFDRWISRQTCMKRPLKWHNQRGKKRTFRESKRLWTKENALSYDSLKFSCVTHKFYPPSTDTDRCFNYFDLQSAKVSDPVRLFSLLSLGEIGRHMYVSMLRLAPPPPPLPSCYWFSSIQFFILHYIGH